MALPVQHKLPTVHMTCYSNNISSAGSSFIRAPFRCKVVKLSAVPHVAISVADNTVTTKIGPAGAAGTAITGGVITVTVAGAAAGQVFSATPTALTLAQADDNIEFAYTGSTTACPCTFEAVLEPV